MSFLLLPAEIWHHIYRYLNTRDIKKCAIICRGWYHIARFYLNNNIRLHVCGYRFEKLVQDLMVCPTLKYRITELVFHKDLDTAEQRNKFKTMLELCTHMREMTLWGSIHPAALNVLYNAKLPHLEQIHGLSMNQQYFKIHLRFRNTITTLCIYQIGKDKHLPEQFGDLVGFTRQFPHLKTLHAEWYERCMEPLDINQLLFMNPCLEQLVLKNVSIKKRYTLNDIKRKTYPPLKQFIMRAKDVHITVLQHILPQLNQLEKFVLYAKNIMPDRSLSKLVAEHIIHSTCYHLPIQLKVIDCRYKKASFSTSK